MGQFIFMADVISSRTKDARQLMRQFKTAIDECNHLFKKELLSPLTITLGDEFQGVAKSLATVADIQIYLEERRIEECWDFKLRYVLNYGPIDTAINKKVAYEMLGEGLTNARSILNDLKKNKSGRFAFLNTQKDEALNDVFLLYSSLVDKWNPADYVLVTKFIHGEDYKDVAAALGKDPSLMWKRRRSLDITEYFAIKRLIKYLLK